MVKINSSLEKINFLIVDDIKTIRNQMISDLKAIGCSGQFFEAESVKMANELFMQKEIDFVICDWNLPDGVGLDFLKKFRAENKFSKTPFVMCTTNDEVSHFLEAIQLGANDFIVKPWNQQDLITKLNSCWKFLKRA